MNTTISQKIAITGGHHSSALPVIELLRSIDKSIEIIWFGHKYSLQGDKNPTLEFIEISGMNIPFINLNAVLLTKVDLILPILITSKTNI